LIVVGSLLFFIGCAYDEPTGDTVFKANDVSLTHRDIEVHYSKQLERLAEFTKTKMRDLEATSPENPTNASLFDRDDILWAGYRVASTKPGHSYAWIAITPRTKEWPAWDARIVSYTNDTTTLWVKTPINKVDYKGTVICLIQKHTRAGFDWECMIQSDADALVNHIQMQRERERSKKGK
jgi:hypothetical protein